VNEVAVHDYFDVPGVAPDKGEIHRYPSSSMPEKTGESVAAHKHGRWRWYKPRPLTLVERKNRPFWVKLLYHGGWYHEPGFQPRDRCFHLRNHFGVWEHDPAKDHLVFRFVWPENVLCRYDPVNDYFWGIHTNPNGQKMLVGFRQDESGMPHSVSIYKTPFRSYRLTDENGRAWFDPRGWATYDNGRVLFHQLEDSPFEPEKTVRPAPGPKRASVLKRTGAGIFETYAEFGITFELTREPRGWCRFDRDGRKWVHGQELYCYDDTGIAPPSYEEFVALLPDAFSKDPETAATAMRTLIRADYYIGWVRENLAHNVPATREAARRLVACFNGKQHVTFTGDRVAWEAMKSGSGTSPELLPIPEQNKESRDGFVETCPLVLDTRRAGVFSGCELVEVPILDHPGYLLVASGHALISRSNTRREYLQVTCDGRLNLIPREAQHAVHLLGQQTEPNRLAALLGDTEGMLAAGTLDIDTGKFDKHGELPWASYIDSGLLIDEEGRMALISVHGSTIFYQREPGGAFTHLDLPRHKMGRRSGVLTEGSSRLMYRALYDKQWDDGEHSEILKFKDGDLTQVGTRIRGHIYNLDWVTEDVLLVATTEPSNMFFINHETGRIPDPPFKLDEPRMVSRFWTDSVRDRQGRFWFVTTWGPDRKTQTFRLQCWDGKELKVSQELRISVNGRTLNPYGGNLCITGEGWVWLSLPERMLVVDTKSLNHRVFRVHDRRGIGVLFPNGDWVMANYGRNTTSFHLRSSSQ
jgi:hypothetical protein